MARVPIPGQLAQFFTLSHDLFCCVDLAGYFLQVNPAFLALLEYSEGAVITHPYTLVVSEEDQPLVADTLARLAQGDVAGVFELQIVSASQQRYWVEVSASLGADNIIYVVARQITERKRLEAQLKLLERGIESSVNGILIADAGQPGLPIVYVNAAFERITGYSREEAIGRNCRFLQGDETDPQAVRVLHEAIDAEREVHVALRNYRRNGALFWNDLYISPVRDESDAVTHYIGVQNDITEQREYQAQIAYNANHDALTGLPNRVLLAQRLEQGCQIAQRHQRYLAVLFIDLDDFKPINDTLGHEVGDFILVEVAKRLEAVLRPWDTVARFGSDEFVVVLPDLADESDALYVVERMLRQLASAYWHNGSEMRITASIGIATSDGKTDRPKGLIQQADLAMYKAKRQGRNTYQWYTEELNQKVSARVALRSALQQAIEQSEFELH